MIDPKLVAKYGKKRSKYGTSSPSKRTVCTCELCKLQWIEHDAQIPGVPMQCMDCGSPSFDRRVYHSKKEATRYLELRALENQGKISNLLCQSPTLEWTVEYKVGDRVYRNPRKQKYIADFEYDEDGLHVVEDVKGHKTAEYKRKKKIVEKLFGIKIRET